MCHKWISGGEKGVAFALLGRIWWRDAQIDRTVGEWWGRFSQNYSSWGSALLLYLQYRVCGIFESIERWEGKASIGSSISTGRQTRIEHRRRRRTRSNETKEEEEHLAPMLEGVTQIIGQSRERKWEGYEEWEKVEETTRETMRGNIGSSIGSTSIHWVGAILTLLLLPSRRLASLYFLTHSHHFLTMLPQRGSTQFVFDNFTLKFLLSIFL